MKKLDKLVFKAFIGPFLITFSVVVFIFLIQFFLNYFSELLGKDLGALVYLKLIFYFAITMTPLSLPLAILLSCLITFGNLGEHMELTAIKASGISLIRVLLPMFIFSSMMMGLSYWFNDRVIPEVNLKAWSLFYDVRQKKPAVDLKEGMFYKGIPNFTIRVDGKGEDEKTLEGVLIYDHTEGLGNNKMVVANKGYMETVNEGEYLKLTLFDGTIYSEQGKNPRRKENFRVTTAHFKENEMLFGLESFKFKKTDEELFKPHRVMNNVDQLNARIDSFENLSDRMANGFISSLKGFYSYHQRFKKAENMTLPKIEDDDWVYKHPEVKDEIFVTQRAVSAARNIKGYTASFSEQQKWRSQELNLYSIEKWKKFTYAFACLAMFLIGAPLGSIIKKGGLGIPVLVAIVFFIIFHVLSLTGEKMAKQGIVEVEYGMWTANFILVIFGLWFLTQARKDSPLFDTDFYVVQFSKLKGLFVKS